MSSHLNILLAFTSLLLLCAVLNVGSVTLDTNQDLAGWRISGCVYADRYEEGTAFDRCRVEITGDEEMNSGYWSFCDSLSSCRLTYTMGDETITAIRIRTFMVPNAGMTSPVTKLTYRNSDGANKFKNFPASPEGWKLIEFMFEEELRTGATIEVSQTGSYNNGTDIALVDKIILSHGLESEPTVIPEITTTEIPEETTEIPEETTEMTEESEITTATTETLRPTTTDQTPPPTTTTETLMPTTTNETPTTTNETPTTTVETPAPTTTTASPSEGIPDDIVFDRNDTLHGWEYDCDYEHDYTILAQKCNATVDTDLNGIGYWSNCIPEECSFNYVVGHQFKQILQEKESYAILGIEVTTFMNSNDAFTSPKFEIIIVYENGEKTIYNLPMQSGLITNYIKADLPLTENSKIEVKQSSNPNSQNKFAMVDKIVLKYDSVEPDAGRMDIWHIILIVLAAVLMLAITFGVCIIVSRKKKQKYAHSEAAVVEEDQDYDVTLQSSPSYVSRVPSPADNYIHNWQDKAWSQYDTASQIIPRAQTRRRF